MQVGLKSPRRSSFKSLASFGSARAVRPPAPIFSFTEFKIGGYGHVASRQAQTVDIAKAAFRPSVLRISAVLRIMWLAAGPMNPY